MPKLSKMQIESRKKSDSVENIYTRSANQIYNSSYQFTLKERVNHNLTHPQYYLLIEQLGVKTFFADLYPSLTLFDDIPDRQQLCFENQGIRYNMTLTNTSAKVVMDT